MGDIFKGDVPSYIANSSDTRYLNGWLRSMILHNNHNKEERRTIVIAMIKQRINEVKLLKLIS